MDYSKFSDDTLKQIASGQPVDYSKLSDDELAEIAGTGAPEKSGVMQTLKDTASGFGAMIPGMHQIGGAGDVINAAVSGQIDPTDLEQVKRTYEKGRQKVAKDEDAAIARSPIASRIGEVPGLIGAALALPEEAGAIGGGALMGGASAALGGNTPFIAGTPEQRDQALGETESGVGLGALLGGAGKLASKGIESALTSAPAKAFLAASKGAKLTGPEAVPQAGQAVLAASDEASQGVEGLRQQVGKARDMIENSQANQDVDLSDSLSNMAKRFESLTGTDRVNAEKEGLLDLIPDQQPPESPIEQQISQLAEDQGLGAPQNPNQMSLKDALDLRQKLRAMAQDQDLHPMVRQAARDGLQYLQSDLQTQVPELRANDAAYNALKNAQKLFGKRYNAQDQLVQSTKQANLLERSGKESISGVSAKQQLQNAMDQIRKVSPDFADQMEQKLGDTLDTFQLAKQANSPDVNLSSLKSSLNKSGSWIGAKAGEGLHAISKNPVMEASKSLYSATDDALRGFSQKLGTQGGETGQRLSQALNSALDNKNQMAKNAILFSIMQNPMLRNLVGADHEEGP